MPRGYAYGHEDDLAKYLKHLEETNPKHPLVENGYDYESSPVAPEDVIRISEEDQADIDRLNSAGVVPDPKTGLRVAGRWTSPALQPDMKGVETEELYRLLKDEEEGINEYSKLGLDELVADEMRHYQMIVKELQARGEKINENPVKTQPFTNPYTSINRLSLGSILPDGRSPTATWDAMKARYDVKGAERARIQANIGGPEMDIILPSGADERAVQARRNIQIQYTKPLDYAFMDGEEAFSRALKNRWRGPTSINISFEGGLQ